MNAVYLPYVIWEMQSCIKLISHIPLAPNERSIKTCKENYCFDYITVHYITLHLIPFHYSQQCVINYLQNVIISQISLCLL